MTRQLLDEAHVDRREFSVKSFAEAEQEDQAHWRSCTPDQRLEALELSRQIAYGYDPTTRGLSRFFEIADFPPR